MSTAPMDPAKWKTTKCNKIDGSYGDCEFKSTSGVVELTVQEWLRISGVNSLSDPGGPSGRTPLDKVSQVSHRTMVSPVDVMLAVHFLLIGMCVT